MTNEEIKAEHDSMCKAIEVAYNRIEEIQSICKHESTSKSNYSWRAGAIDEAIFCDYCGKVLKTIQPFDLNTVLTVNN